MNSNVCLELLNGSVTVCTIVYLCLVVKTIDCGVGEVFLCCSESDEWSVEPQARGVYADGQLQTIYSVNSFD